MQKKTTLKDFKVFLLKTFLSILVLGISFQVTVAQDLKMKGRADVNKPLTKPQRLAAIPPARVEATDVPEINQRNQLFHPNANATVSISKNTVPSIANPIGLPTSNLVQDVCTFNGGLVTGDLTLTNGRPFRGGVPSSCASVPACGTPVAGSGFLYDTYTMQNLTCAAQCVTVNYIANAGGGDCFVTAYLGTFNPLSLCTNRIADGGSSSLSGGAAVSFTFNLAVNATVVFVVNGAVAGTQCPSYTMTVTGLNCTPPPPCQAPTSSVLSQVQIPAAPVQLFNQNFDGAIPPAGWPVQNLSNPLGATGWFQNPTPFPPHAGAGYAAANFNNTGNLGTISNWMFTPNVNLKNGDVFTFWTRTTTGTFPDRLQLRMSTNGNSVNVGATELSVGDFSTLLIDINPNLTTTGYPTSWTQFTATMSGLPVGGISGRLAFRYFVTGAGLAGANSDFIGIDDAIYTTTTTANPQTCTGSTANLKVDITGGAAAAYNVTINANPPGGPGGNFTVNNYVSGSNIPVTPAVTTTYSLVSVIAADNPCCIGTGNTGTPTITVSATPVPSVAITALPDAPLCAGDPTLLTAVTGSPIVPVCVSQSTSNAITAGNSVSCNAGGINTDNSYWRVYNLATYGLPGALTINSVKFGIELAAGGPQNLTVRLYNQTGAAFPGGTRTLIGTQVVSVPNQTASIFTANFVTPVTVPNNSVIVVELFTPNGAGVRSFFIGSNAAAETGPSYLSAADCGVATPTTTAAIGFPNMHIILDICGTTGTGATPLPAGATVLWSPAAGLSNPVSNPVAASPMTTTTYQVLVTFPGGCQTTAQKTITVNQLPAVLTNPSNVVVCTNGNATFSVTGSGAGLTYQWQVSTAGPGGPWNNITNGGNYAGATTATLAVNNIPLSFNNNRYRCVLSGTCPPSATSGNALLTVNGLPVITITPAGPVCGGVAGLFGTQLSTGSAPPPVPGSVTVNSGTINLAVPDNTATGVNSILNVAGIPANATITNVTVTLNMSHTYPGDMIYNLKAPNGQILNLYKYGTGVFTGPASGNATWGWYGARVSQTGNTAWSTVAAAPFIYSAGPNWKADAINTPVAGAVIQDPAGFVSNAPNFAALYTTGPSANGAWNLAMCDGGPGDIGSLASWTIVIDYTTPGVGAPVTFTWAPTAGLYTDANASIGYTGTQTPTVYAAPTATTIYTVTGTSTTTGCVNTATVKVLYTPPAPLVTPNPVAMCLGDAAVRLISASATPGTCTVSSGTISVAVPDNTAAGASTNLNVACVPNGATVTGVSVTINMANHTYVGDMIFNLKAPNGAILNLDKYMSATATQAGTYPNSGFVNAVISSAGVNGLGTATTTPITGTWKADLLNAAVPFTIQNPTGFASNAAGWSALYSTPNGTWTLAMADGGPGDLGTLTSWSIKIDYYVGVPTTAAIWTPIAGLFNDAAASSPYVAGTPRDTVWAKPTPSGVYTYTATVNGIPEKLENPAPIAINDNAPGSPYPSIINVSGYPTTGVAVKNVILKGMSHTWGDDVDILLQSPTGQNVVLMSDVGGTVAIPNATYTFDDAAPAMNPTAANPTGSYHVTNNGATDTWVAPGPGSITQAAPALSLFGSAANVNGDWKLFVIDDVGGDFGNISGGWEIVFNPIAPGCQSPGRSVVVTVNQPISITTQPVNATVCTDKVTSFTVVATGTTPTYQWQVSTDAGNTWNNVNNGGVYSGATTATLTITAPPVTMNGYLYRCMVSGAAPCPAVPSASRLLTVNPLPTIVISASPYYNLLPTLSTTLFSTSSPAAATYTWLKNDVAVPGATASSLLRRVDDQGRYRLRVTDVNGCTNVSNQIFIGDSTSGRVFISPNPTTGQFVVRYNPAHNNVLPRGVNIFDAMGKRILTQTYTLGIPFAPMPVDLRNHGTGVYWVEVVDVNGDRLAVGRVEVIR